MHRLFHVMAVVSAVLCVATCVLCARAQFGCNDYLEWQPQSHKFPERPSPDDDSASWQMWTEEVEDWDRKQWRVHVRANSDAIFASGRQPFWGYPRNWFDFHLHYVVLIPALAIVPLMTLARVIYSARKARRHGYCTACGYDLRASKDRCPECGTPISAKASDEATAV